MNADIFGFGYNNAGQLSPLSQDTLKECSLLSHLQTLPTMKSITCGGGTTMLLSESNQVYSYGSIGGKNGKVIQFPHVNEQIKWIKSGEEHVMFVTNKNKVLAMGWNLWGQLGIASIERNTMAPTLVPYFGEAENIAGIVCGPYCTFVMVDAGKEVYVMGHNNNGQCGVGNKQEKIMEPTLCVFEDDGQVVEKIVSGYNHSVALAITGDVYVCGSNFYGQIGRQSCTSFSKIDFDGKKAIDVAAGFEHTIVLLEGDEIWVSGRNQHGELGLGHTSSVKHFQQLSLFNVKEIHCGYHFSLFVAKNGTLWSCGSNQYGNLGVGHLQNQTTPQFVRFPDQEKKKSKSQQYKMIVSCGGRHTIIMRSKDSFVTIERDIYRALLDSKLQLELDLKEQKQIVREYEAAIKLLQDDEQKKKSQVDIVILYENEYWKYSVLPKQDLEEFQLQILSLLEITEAKVNRFHFSYWDEKFQMYLNLHQTKDLPEDLKLMVSRKKLVTGDDSKNVAYWEINEEHIRTKEHITSDFNGILYKAELATACKKVDLTKSGTSLQTIKQSIADSFLLVHPFILKCIGLSVNSDETEANIITELCSDNIMQYCELKKPTLSTKLKLLMEICQGMQYYHSQQLIHRNLCPEMIMMTKDGHVRIIPDPDIVTGDGNFIGKLPYFSPEFYFQTYTDNANPTYDHRIDIYSFGILMYQIMTMKAPYEEYLASHMKSAMTLLKKIHTSVPVLRPNLDHKDVKDLMPDRMKTIIAQCWDTNPDFRLQSFNDVFQQLQKVTHQVELFDQLMKNKEMSMPDQTLTSKQSRKFNVLMKYQDVSRRVTANDIDAIEDLQHLALNTLELNGSPAMYRFQYYDKDFEQNVELESLDHVPSKMILTVVSKAKQKIQSMYG